METRTLRNLADLSCLELKEFLDSIDNVLCDCSGVLWIFNTPVADAHKTILKLKELGKRVGAVSNNTTRKVAQHHDLFKQLNFNIGVDWLVYPTIAIIDYLKSINFDKELFVIGCSAILEELVDAGFKLADAGDLIIEESVAAFQSSLKDNHNVGAVIFDFDINLTYIKLAKASVYLQRPDVIYITGSTEKVLPVGMDVPVIGLGGVQESLKDFIGKPAISLGKPGKELNDYVRKTINIKDPSRTLFIGDSLTQDIYFANKYGYRSLLVLTGAAKLEDLEGCPKNMVPDFYVNSISDIYSLISEKLNI